MKPQQVKPTSNQRQAFRTNTHRVPLTRNLAHGVRIRRRSTGHTAAQTAAGESTQTPRCNSSPTQSEADTPYQYDQHGHVVPQLQVGLGTMPESQKMFHMCPSNRHQATPMTSLHFGQKPVLVCVHVKGPRDSSDSGIKLHRRRQAQI